MSDNINGMGKYFFDDSFVRWIENRADEKEASKWEAWSKENVENTKLASDLRYLHKNIRFKKSNRTELQSELNRLNSTINAGNIAKESYKGLYFFRNNIWRYIPRIAAVFLLLITVFAVYKVAELGYFQQNVSETVVEEFTITATENGQKKILTLSDGSTITMNANSQVKYPTKSLNGNVEVWLEGEAYFDIVRKSEPESRTFSVHIPNGKVSVLGTKFNVNSYDNETQVFLQEGKVSLELIDSLDQIRDTYIMSPGEISSISQTSKSIHTKMGNVDICTSWIDDKLVFENASLEDVATRLGHIYQVNFELQDLDSKNILVSGSLPNNNLTVFINALENLVGSTIVVEDSTVYVGKHINSER